MVPFERTLMSSYRPSIVTFPPSLRISDIAAFVQNAIFPTPPLVSQKFPHVPLGVDTFAKSEGVGLIACAISFQDFQPM